MEQERRSVPALTDRPPSPLRLRRLLRGLSLDAVAHSIGCSPSHLARAELGFTELKPELVQRLDAILSATAATRRNEP
jgi:transcriptional regulator with XRE-family HTH domain